MAQAPILAWAAFHTIWVTLLVWMMAAGLQLILRPARARTRHAAACLAFFSAILIAMLTAAVILTRPSADLGRPHILPNGQTDVLLLPSMTLVHWCQPLGVLLPYALGTWTLCAVAKLGWLLFARWSASQAVGRARPILSDSIAGWPNLKTALAPDIFVKVVESPAAESPATFGWRQPVIWLPDDYCRIAGPTDLEAVLAHELAHIGRSDYLFNVMQIAVESLFFFNIGIVLLSRTVRQRRESCCDELAVAALGIDYSVYIAAIFRLAKTTRAGHTVPAAAGSLLERFRYLRHYPHYVARPAWFLRITAGVVIAMIAIGAATTSAVQRVSVVQEVELLQREDFTASVYDLLGEKEADNPKFLLDLQLAVREFVSHKAISDLTAIVLARDIEAGVRHDALMTASMPSFTASSPRPLTTRGWTGGGKLDWQNVATELERLACQEADISRRRELSRAALLLAAQNDLTPGNGRFRTLASDPKCLNYACVTEDASRKLWTILSVSAADSRYVMLMTSDWEASKPAVVSSKLIAAAHSRPYLQFVICNMVDRLHSTEPLRYDSLRISLKRAKMEIVDRLMP